MSLFKQKNDYYSDALRVEHTPSTSRSFSSAAKKRTSIINIYEKSIFSSLSKILFFSMLVLTAAVSAVEIRNYISYTQDLGIIQFLYKLAFTAFLMWAAYCIILIPICIAAIHHTSSSFRRRQLESGIKDETSEDSARSKRAVIKLALSYYIYLSAACFGLIIWGLFLLITIAVKN